MYFSKVLVRTDNSLEFWKENFVNGLPKHFSRRIKDSLKTKYNGTILWKTLSYGAIASFIIEEDSDFAMSQRFKTSSILISNRKELEKFCDQYGCKGIEAPSTSRRKKVKTYPKSYRSYRPREKYRSKPVQSQKPTYSKKRYIPTRSQRSKRNQGRSLCQ